MNGRFQQESAINLLIVTSSPNYCEECVSNLRNAGILARAAQKTTEEALAEALKTSSLDIIIYSWGSGKSKPKRILSLCQELCGELPLIVTVDQEHYDEVAPTAMNAGARDIVRHEDTTHLNHTIAREYQSLQTLRELKQLNLRIAEMDERCAILVEQSHDAIAYIHEGMYIHANRAYLERFGYIDMDEIEGLPILDMIAPEKTKEFKKLLKSINTNGAITEIDTRCRNNEGEEFEARLQFCSATIDGEPCTQITIQDRSLDKDLQQKLHQLSSLDMQTALPNRQYFIEQLNTAVQDGHKSGAAHALVYVLLDDFGKVRSAAGMAGIDTVFKEISEILQGSCGDETLVGRFGDHTFVALTTKKKAASIAEDIRKKIEDNIYSGLDIDLQTTCSIGISHMNSDTDSDQALVDHAYLACEDARNNGGNRVVQFDPSVHTGVEETSEQEESPEPESSDIETTIQSAIDNDKIRLHFQPIVSLQGDSREKYDVIPSLEDSEGTELLSDEKIAQLEDHPIAVKLNRWVIKHAIAKLKEKRTQGHKVVFFITLSAASLQDETLLLWVCDCLHEQDAKGPWLTFQIREDGIRANTQSAKVLLEGLKKIRCKVALAQFGLHPKGSVLLQRLPIDYVKLSDDFMSELASEKEAQDRLNETNRVVQSFDVQSIANGVQDANALAVLWTAGVDYIQGDFVQKPSETIIHG